MLYLLILIANSLFAIETYIPKTTHYDVMNYNLRILNLSEDNFIFYGDNGGVLRTSDAGISWQQISEPS